jgi:hypothetical protein
LEGFQECFGTGAKRDKCGRSERGRKGGEKWRSLRRVPSIFDHWICIYVSVYQQKKFFSIKNLIIVLKIK